MSVTCESFSFSRHAVQQMFSRGVSVEQVKNACKNGEVIREYTDDKPYPSFLILDKQYDRPLHVVIAITDELTCIVVTAYIPDLTIWMPDYKTKRQQ